jgi:hypothetical protein
MTDAGRLRLVETLRGVVVLDTQTGVVLDRTDAHVRSDHAAESVAAAVVALVDAEVTHLQVGGGGYLRARPGKLWPELARRDVHPEKGQAACVLCGVCYPAYYLNSRDVCVDCQDPRCLPKSSTGWITYYFERLLWKGVRVRVESQATREGERVKDPVTGRVKYVPVVHEPGKKKKGRRR